MNLSFGWCGIYCICCWRVLTGASIGMNTVFSEHVKNLSIVSPGPLVVDVTALVGEFVTGLVKNRYGVVSLF